MSTTDLEDHKTKPGRFDYGSVGIGSASHHLICREDDSWQSVVCLRDRLIKYSSEPYVRAISKETSSCLTEDERKAYEEPLEGHDSERDHREE